MAAWVEALFPAGVVAEVLHDLGTADPLWPQEQQHVQKAVEKRRREFAAGRTCARRAMARLGVAPGPIPSGPDRAPRWPEGVVGSISHSHSLCMAVAGPRDQFAGLGVDAEQRDRVGPRLWKQIASVEEIAWFEATADAQAQRVRASLLFSAKEAFYKAQYCVSGAWVGFLDARVQVSPDLQRFELTLTRAIEGLGPAGMVFPGRCTDREGHAVAACAITAPNRC